MKLSRFLLIIRQLGHLPASWPINNNVFPWISAWISVYAILHIPYNLNTFLTLSTACRAHEAQDSKDSYSYHQEDLFERFTTGLPETPICLKHHVLKQQKATTFALTGNRDKMFSILWASGSQGSEYKTWKCGHGLVPGVGLCSFFLPGGPCSFI